LGYVSQGRQNYARRFDSFMSTERLGTFIFRVCEMLHHQLNIFNGFCLIKCVINVAFANKITSRSDLDMRGVLVDDAIPSGSLPAVETVEIECLFNISPRDKIHCSHL
jgi:hypothetical protein